MEYKKLNQASYCLRILPLLLIFTIIGCSKPLIKHTQQTDASKQEKTLPLTVGNVKKALFKSLQNRNGITPCFNDNPLIQFTTLRGTDAYQSLKKLNLQEYSSINNYLKGLYSQAEKTSAVMVNIQKPQKQQYIYIPNDGTYGIKIINNDDTDVDLGILIDLTQLSDIAATKTCVTCTIESGKKGQGCSCTQATKTVCCSTPGCSPTCGTGFQCKWDCNRADDTCFDICRSSIPFEDTRPFASLPSGEKF